MAISHPAQAARAMLERKGIEYELKNVPIGTQPIAVRLAGFRGRTVPALKIDGRRGQGSIEIARVLDQLAPEPPLYPRDPERRRGGQGGGGWGGGGVEAVP